MVGSSPWHKFVVKAKVKKATVTRTELLLYFFVDKGTYITRVKQHATEMLYDDGIWFAIKCSDNARGWYTQFLPTLINWINSDVAGATK